MTFLKVVGAIVLVLIAGVVLINLSMSKEDHFKYDAQRLVEQQMGSDANVSEIQVYTSKTGEVTACGQVSHRENLMPGMSGNITSPFYVKGGVVIVGIGDTIQTVLDAQAHQCQLQGGA